jgi:hypothetical protein
MRRISCAAGWRLFRGEKLEIDFQCLKHHLIGDSSLVEVELKPAIYRNGRERMKWS